MHELNNGARESITKAVTVESKELLSRYKVLDTEGRHCVGIHNGYLPERIIQTGEGVVPARFYPS